MPTWAGGGGERWEHPGIWPAATLTRRSLEPQALTWVEYWLPAGRGAYVKGFSGKQSESEPFHTG